MSASKTVAYTHIPVRNNFTTRLTMGTYYRYVNYTRGEFVCLSDLRDGGDKEMAALYCAPALAWLIVWPHTCGDGYRGRWALSEKERSSDIRIVRDCTVNFADMDDDFVNITPGLLQSMRVQVPDLVVGYLPRIHDVHLVQRVPRPVALYELADPCSATCKCGWKTGPIRGEHRERDLELLVAAHVTAV